MKPSPEQVREWAEKAGARFDPHWGISYNVGTATFERFAELATKWGYDQATNFKPDWANYNQGRKDGKAEALEQAQVEEPELPEAVAWGVSATAKDGNNWMQSGIRLDRAAAESDAAMYLKSCNPVVVPLFTTTQMHDHYAAGVRAGMARGQSLQALQRGFEKVLADPEKHGLDLGDQK